MELISEHKRSCSIPINSRRKQVLLTVSNWRRVIAVSFRRQRVIIHVSSWRKSFGAFFKKERNLMWYFQIYIRHFSFMNSQILFESTAPGKLLKLPITCEMFYVCMNSLVLFQITSFRKFLEKICRNGKVSHLCAYEEVQSSD